MVDTVQRLQKENAALRRQVRALKARRERKRYEFSKVIFVGVSIVTLAITLFTCVLAWITRDTSVLCYLIPAVFAEMASATGFYYSKAKAENEIKLAASYGAKHAPKTNEEIGG